MFDLYDVDEDEDDDVSNMDEGEFDNFDSETYDYNHYVSLVFDEKIPYDPTHGPLIKMIKNKNINRVISLYSKARKNVKPNDEVVFTNGLNPLIYAAMNASYELIEYFLKKNNNVDFKVTDTNMTPIVALCLSRYNDNDISFEKHHDNVYECAKLLIEHGADLTVTIKPSKNSILHLAAANNYYKLIDLFLDKLDVDEVNGKNCTPIMLACAFGNTEMAMALKKSGSDLSLKNDCGMTASDLALINGHHVLAEELKAGKMISQFYRAWAVVFKDLEDTDSDSSNATICKRLTDSCTAVNVFTPLSLSHLEPIFHEKKITLDDLRLMSDSELKQIGVKRYVDRKNILNIMQESHKFRWRSDKCLPDIDFSQLLKPMVISDLLMNISNQLSFIYSSVQYMKKHFQTNPGFYRETAQTNKMFEKIQEQHGRIFEISENVEYYLSRIDDTFQVVSQSAFEDDERVHLDNLKVDKEFQSIYSSNYESIMKNSLFLSSFVGIGIGAAFMLNRLL